MIPAHHPAHESLPSRKTPGRCWFAALVLVSGAPFLERPAGACEAPNETLFGPTNVNAQVGNGGLTAAVAATGELTALSWPSPSYTDQLTYQTALGEGSWDLPYRGAGANQGVFAGLRASLAGGEVDVSWFRDAPWVSSQTYRSDRSSVAVTQFRRDDLGLTVVQSDVVLADVDALVRRVEVLRDAGSEVDAVRLLAFANLGPTRERLAFFPTADWQDDIHNDFVSVYDATDQAVLAGRPDGADLSSLDGLLADEADAAALLERVDTVFPGLAASWESGVWLALAGGTGPSGFQVGADDTLTCPAGRGWGVHPQDAYTDASDGQLSGYAAAGCQTNAALSFDGSFATSGTDALQFDLFLAAGADPDGAAAALAAARELGFDEGSALADAGWESRLAHTALPGDEGSVTRAFAERWALSLLQGMDRDTGAIVASVAIQPPYRQDWPRDGAFMTLALDAVGLVDEATRHALFTASVQVAEDTVGVGNAVTPKGAWFMNYYADGLPGGFIPFEIDQTALALWSLSTHGRFIPQDEARRRYFLEVVAPVVRAGDLLATCVEADFPGPVDDGATVAQTLRARLESGQAPEGTPDREAALAAGEYERLLPCLANEDDDPDLTRSAYSTHTVRIGLLAAADLLEDMDRDAVRVSFYRERAGHLAAALAGLWWDEGTGSWSDAAGRLDWMLWPTPPFANGDGRGQAIAAAALDQARLDLGLQTEGGAYPGKAVLALARHWRHDGGALDSEVAPLVTALVEAMPTPGTRHVGETWCSVDADGDGTADTFENHTAVPHLWTATLSLLAALATEDPEALAPIEQSSGWWPAGDGGAVDVTRPAIECGCAVRGADRGGRGSPGGRAALFSALTTAFALAARRRRPR